MKPILYSDIETAFDTNGIGVLYDTTSAIVGQELNGIYELTMKYPLSGIHAENITDRSIILAKVDHISELQPFRVYRIVPTSKGIITVYARHIVYDTLGIPVSPFKAASAAVAMQNVKANAVVDCPFTFTTDVSAAADLVIKTPKSIWNVLGGTDNSVLSVYGGEYEFDRYNITLHTQRGSDRGVTIRYAKNLKTLEQDRNCSACYTGVYPYWASNSEDNPNLVQLTDKVVYVAGEHNYVRILDLDLSSVWDEAPTEDELRVYTQKYIEENEIGVPDISWTVTFASLEQTEEYKGKKILEGIAIGDTVSVFFPKLNMSVSARAVACNYNVLLERYEDITLGKVKTDLTTIIVKQKQELDRKPGVSLMLSIASKLTESITGAKGGAVRLLDTDGDGLPDELYIADDPDPNLALKVWRFNYEGWAASKTGYNGPFVFGATLDNGLLANFVTAAHLTAGTIQNQDGSLFIDLDNGIVRMKAISDMDDSLKKLSEAIAEIDGAFFYVRYSQYPNGLNMTETPTADTLYMGTCSTSTQFAPADPSAYTWIRVRGNDGIGTIGPTGNDGKTSYLHIKYSNDGKTFTANNGEELGAYIGTLVDFTEVDSMNFDDYTWKKFTEDVDEELDEIRKTMLEQYTQIINDSESIIMSALESYVQTGSYEEFKRTTESQIKLFSEQMTLKFSETTSQLAEINGDLQTKFNTITKYFTFDINGMTIGAVDNPNKVVIDNDEISILVNGVIVQRFDSNGRALTPELEVTRSLNLLGYQISKDSAGNVNCQYVGG